MLRPYIKNMFYLIRSIPVNKRDVAMLRLYIILYKIF
jgi:hypothetical protein